MKCPICKKPVAETAPLLPFCSERCKEIDLGNWATGKYVVSTPLRPSDLEQIQKRTSEGYVNGSAYDAGEDE